MMQYCVEVAEVLGNSLIEKVIKGKGSAHQLCDLNLCNFPGDQFLHTGPRIKNYGQWPMAAWLC